VPGLLHYVSLVSQAFNNGKPLHHTASKQLILPSSTACSCCCYCCCYGVFCLAAAWQKWDACMFRYGQGPGSYRVASARSSLQDNTWDPVQRQLIACAAQTSDQQEHYHHMDACWMFFPASRQVVCSTGSTQVLHSQTMSPLLCHESRIGGAFVWRAVS
jgi:hypothetical protein